MMEFFTHKYGKIIKYQPPNSINVQYALETMNMVTNFNKSLLDNNLTGKSIDANYFFKECSVLIMTNAKAMHP